MSNEPHAPDNGNRKPTFLSLSESAHPLESGLLPIADETLAVIPGKTTSIENQVLQIWDDLRRRGGQAITAT